MLLLGRRRPAPRRGSLDDTALARIYFIIRNDEDARIRLRRFRSFPIAYQACTDADQAIADLRRIEAVFAGSPIEVSFHSPTTRRLRGLRIYRADEPVVPAG